MGTVADGPEVCVGSLFQDAAQKPPGRIDAAAIPAPLSGSIQCHACAEYNTSHPITSRSSRVGTVTSMPCRRPIAAILWSGSTPTTATPRWATSLVGFPVPHFTPAP